MELTREQWERLARFDAPLQPFRTVLDSGYMRAISSRDTDELLAVYREATGTDYDLHRDCGQCVMAFVKIMGYAYRQAGERYKDEPKKKYTKPKTQKK